MYESQDVADRIRECARLKNTSVKKILEDAGLGYNTMTTYRKSMPKADNLAKIADSLGCSVDYLLGRSSDMNPPEPVVVSLPPDEEKLLARYRGLDDDGREIVLSCALKELRRVNSERGEETEAVG